MDERSATQAWMLLQVMNLAAGYPKLKALQDEAEAALVEMAETAQKVLNERKAEAKRKEQEEKESAIQAQEEVSNDEPKPKAIPSAAPETNGRRA